MLQMTKKVEKKHTIRPKISFDGDPLRDGNKEFLLGGLPQDFGVDGGAVPPSEF